MKKSSKFYPLLLPLTKGENFKGANTLPLLAKEGKQVVTGILTISDRCAKGVRKDEGGPCLKRLALQQGWKVAKYEIVPDDLETIAKTLKSWCRQNGLNVILTTGGTGVGPRDVTPEATAQILEKELPGISEQLRREGTKHTPFAILSRAKAGVRKNTLIINLPGNPKSLEESFPILEQVIPHTLKMMAGENH